MCEGEVSEMSNGQMIDKDLHLEMSHPVWVFMVHDYESGGQSGQLDN